MALLTRELPRDSDSDRAKRLVDVVVAGTLLALLAPVILVVAAWIRVQTPGPAFFRCRRTGFGGGEFGMLKFPKMHDGAAGSALTAPADDRFTSVGRLLARSKLDELPQLWNVLTGEMSLVGPRPEDPSFVALEPTAYERILRVRPGITGLSQLAFARESEILDPVDRDGDYVRRVLPQKVLLDQFYAAQRSLG